MPQRNVVCYRCNQRGHYSPQCPNPSVPRTGYGNSGDLGGRGGYVFPCRDGRGGVNGAYYLWVPHSEGTSDNDSVTHSVSPSYPPPNLLSNETYPLYSGVHHDRIILVVDQQCECYTWIFNNGWTAHSASTRQMFTSLEPCHYLMYAANGALINVTGIGTAGTVPNVLYLPDLQVILFSQKQAILCCCLGLTTPEQPR